MINRIQWLVAVGLISASGAVMGEGRIYAEDGVAISGADPVAYFELGEATQGSSEHSYEWRGVEWHFANPDHRAMFAENPEKYAPEYGGWCAWAAARGDAAATSPQAWAIEDGDLYLNYNQSIQTRWEKDVQGFIERADDQWPDIF
jgi:YHS domain-containing protein